MRYALNPEPKREAASRNYYAAKQRKLDACNNAVKLNCSQDLEVIPDCILRRDIDAAHAMLDLCQVESVYPDSADHVSNVACQEECVNQDSVDDVSGVACQSDNVSKVECVCRDLVLGIAGHSFLTRSQQRVEQLLSELEAETTKH